MEHLLRKTLEENTGEWEGTGQREYLRKEGGC
jgi:hypothetical protein